MSEGVKIFREVFHDDYAEGGRTECFFEGREIHIVWGPLAWDGSSRDDIGHTILQILQAHGDGALLGRRISHGVSPESSDVDQRFDGDTQSRCT
jgi:hypothetical protein